MKRTLTIGFSPCPNDTFIFDALVNGKIDTGAYEFQYVLEDVETLNMMAGEGRLDITKLSYNAYLHLTDLYVLLHSGSALGKGVGPLLVSRGPVDEAQIPGLHIAIPGRQTTANLLLSLAFPEAVHKTEMVFHEIEAAVLSGRTDAGLLIHENRFTYETRGLHRLLDLGAWWEQSVGALIPLGGIVMRRGTDAETLADIDRLIRESLAYAWSHYPDLPGFVTRHAREMEEPVMRSHIGLYVNSYTDDLGEEGRRSVEMLFKRASEAGLIRTLPPSDRIFR